MNKPIPPLSPTAQAVLDAYNDAPVIGGPHGGDALGVAAAIRALADQVVPYMAEPDWGASSYNCDIELYADNKRIRAEILARAAELDGGAYHPTHTDTL
jgi:hypothetical protein